MKVHSYYYGPRGNGGIDFSASPELTKILDEDVIRDLYSRESRKTVQFSELYTSLQGPVIGVTRIEQTQNHDKRPTTRNVSVFVRLSDFVNEVLIPLLDQQQDFPAKEIVLKFQREG